PIGRYCPLSSIFVIAGPSAAPGSLPSRMLGARDVRAMPRRSLNQVREGSGSECFLFWIGLARADLLSCQFVEHGGLRLYFLRPDEQHGIGVENFFRLVVVEESDQRSFGCQYLGLKSTCVLVRVVEHLELVARANLEHKSLA